VAPRRFAVAASAAILWRPARLPGFFSQGRDEEQGFAGPNKERLIMSHPVPRDMVARMLAYLLVQMLVLLLAQMLALPGWFGGVFGVCFFNRPRH